MDKDGELHHIEDAPSYRRRVNTTGDGNVVEVDDLAVVGDKTTLAREVDYTTADAANQKDAAFFLGLAARLQDEANAPESGA
jgi:hypothetical protein